MNLWLKGFQLIYSNKSFVMLIYQKRQKIDNTLLTGTSKSKYESIKNMVKDNFRLEIKSHLDKAHSILGLQCVANEVIERNLARWLSVMKNNECQIPWLICLISNKYMKSNVNINLNSSSRMELSSLKSSYDVFSSIRP